MFRFDCLIFWSNCFLWYDIEISCTSSFSASRIKVEKNMANKTSLTMLSQFFKPVSLWLRWSGFRHMSGTNVVSAVTAQPARKRGVSRAVKMTEYFRVPELTMPHKNWNTWGMNCAISLETHKLSHSISIQVKNQTMRTPPIVAFLANVAPMTIGTAMTRASGRT